MICNIGIHFSFFVDEFCVEGTFELGGSWVGGELELGRSWVGAMQKLGSPIFYRMLIFISYLTEYVNFWSRDDELFDSSVNNFVKERKSELAIGKYSSMQIGRKTERRQKREKYLLFLPYRTATSIYFLPGRQGI
jgi:hypothetical protein